MPKNIVIFSDGTGQAGGLPKKAPTNVYRLFRACPVIPGVQVTFYEHGVGAPPISIPMTVRRKLYNKLCGATGLGVSHNIAEAYDALIRMYEPGDRIFLFGFSRGGYTVRSLAGLIAICGIPRKSPHGLDLHSNAPARRRVVRHAVRDVYQTYGRSEARKKLRHGRGHHFRQQHQSHEGVVPYFVGVWDTVRAIGLPGVSRLVFWRHRFHDSTLDQRVPYGRQALSIDENRAVFYPELWDEAEADVASGRIKQVWFPGIHSDVGGGYHERELADIALDWMVSEATAIPEALIVDKEKLDLKPSYKGMQHDQRRGLGLLWFPGTRERFRTRALAFEDVVQKRLKEKAVPTVRGESPYRPPLLAQFPQFVTYYQAIQAKRRSLHSRLLRTLRLSRQGG